MSKLVHDTVYAVRRAVQNPWFALLIVATLALGIGANTAIFSVVHAVLLRPLPYPESARLVTAFHYYPNNDLEAGFGVPTYRDIGERTRTFEHYAVLRGWGVNFTGQAQPERLLGVLATAGYFSTLGVPAQFGRTFLEGEDQTGRDRIVVLSHGFWQRALGGRREAIGTTLQLNGEPYEIVGVMPPGFRDLFQREAELWAPLAFEPEQFAEDRRTSEFLQMIGRLGSGVPPDQAARDMSALAEQLKRDYPNAYPPNWTLVSRPLAEQGRRVLRPALMVLLGAVSLVLLIACANIANLLLARAAGRRREYAVRTALGATRAALVRQLLAESMVLSVAGGVLGLLVAFWSLRVLEAFGPTDLLQAHAFTLDTPVLLFTLVVALATGVLFGILPALHASRGDVHTGLRDGGRSATGDGGQVLRRGLVVAEIALALVLLVSAGLLIRSFARLQQVDPGFDPQHLLTMNLALPEATYESGADQTAFWDRLLPAIAVLPGVEGVGATQVVPFSGGWSTGSFSVEGHQPPPGQNPWGDIRIVSVDYHRTMRIRLLRGRFFNEDDREGGRRVAVVDDEMVRRYWPNEDPIGKRLAFGDADGPDVEWIDVVGVVAHTAHEGLDADRRIQLYLPYRQRPLRSLSLVVRTGGDPAAMVNAVRRTVLALDPDQPISRVRTMEELMARTAGQRQLSTVLLGVFAGLAALLAALGIYGVMSFDVTRRTQEMGLRMALGAARRDVMGLVLGQGARLAGLGLVIGVVGALAAGRLIEAQLFGIRMVDPVTYLVVACVLGAIALCATLLPAVRATRVDPMEALRYE
jgi:putative ABC transport system permease protein